MTRQIDTEVRAFTLLEILIVMIILGVISGVAFTKYSKAIEQNHESDAKMQLTAIHGTNQLYHAKTGSYWPPNSNSYNTASINSALGMNLIESGLTFSCTGTDGSTFTCTAVRTGAASFTITITQNDLSATNPRCTAGACPSA